MVGVFYKGNCLVHGDQERHREKKGVRMPISFSAASSHMTGRLTTMSHISVSTI